VKKRKYVGTIEVLLIVLLVIVLYQLSGLFFRKPNENVLSRRTDHPNRRDRDSEDKKNNTDEEFNLPSITIARDQINLGAEVTVSVTLPPITNTQNILLNQSVITVAPTDIRNNHSESVVTPKTDYSTTQVLEMVSVTERSVVQSSNYATPVITKSVLKVIQNKIEQVGRGEILSKPTPTSIPTSISEDKSVEDQLSGDVDIFYRLSGTAVLLGAENSEGRQLQISESDLRSAEITLNKVLDKKNLRLSITEDNNFALVEGSVFALTSMPVHVNIDSHNIYLVTGEGKKQLKILPEEAVIAAVELKSFEKLSRDSVPTIEDLGEELAYKVIGDKTYKAFGYFKVVAKQNVYITAETGDVVEGDQPLITKIIRLISL
jgi:hypothetical protein